MSVCVFAPDVLEPKWVSAVSFEWCRDGQGITLRQYRVTDDNMVYRHFATPGEFQQATQVKVPA